MKHEISWYLLRVKHDKYHRIETYGTPCFAKTRRLAPERARLVKSEFETLLRQGVLRPSKSNFSSALHVVPKKNGDIRPYGDYRALNSQTILDRYSITNIQDLTAHLGGTKIFSRLDLVKAFHQIPIHPDHIHKPAITTPFGLYEFTKLPDGLKNAAQSFQRFIDNTIRGLPFVDAYIDDLLVASSDHEQHKVHLQQLCQRLCDHGLKINLAKCEFGRTTIDFLGHTISANKIEPFTSKCSALANFPRPRTQREFKRFLGMINYYNRFISNCASILSPLYALVKPAKSGRPIKLQWTTDAEKAFNSARNQLTSKVSLALPQANAKTSIATDASDSGLGAVLQQEIDNEWKPIAFFSKKLTAAESKYSAFDRELLAVYSAIKHFRYFIEGRDFHIFSDHKPLTTVFSVNKSSYSPRQFRHIDFISQFTTDIRYIKGTANTTADALSGSVFAIKNSDAPVDYAKIAEDEVNDTELKSLLNSPSLSFKQKKIRSISCMSTFPQNSFVLIFLRNIDG